MAIIIDSNFPGGGVEDVNINAGNTISFAAPVDGSLTNTSLWFYFRVQGAKGRRLCFVQQDMNHTLGALDRAGYKIVRPVKREGKDGTFIRIPIDDTVFNQDPLTFSFFITPQSDETYIAFCYPYQYADLLRFQKAHSDLLDLRIIGRTGEGRDYPVLVAGDNGDKNKKLIIAAARQHSGETPGSFVLEGFMEQYLRKDDTGIRLRDKSVLLVLPMAHLDGVEEGRYGKNSPPQDFYNAWETESIRVELHDFLGVVDKMANRYKPGMFVDFHAPQPGAPSFIVPGQSSVLNPDGWKRVNQFIDLFEQLTMERGSCRRQDLDKNYLNWNGKYNRLLASRVLAEWYRIDTLSLESGYHIDCCGRYLEPQDWFFMGRQFCDGVEKTWFEDYDLPYVTLSTYETLWDGWEMITLPVNTVVTAKKGTYKAEAAGKDATVFFGDSNKVLADDKGSYILSCTGTARIICHIYHRRAGKTAKKSRPYYFTLNNDDATILFSFFNRDGYDSFYAAFHAVSLEGILTVIRT
jgi:murein tripeptide amidase MpaA